MTRSRSEPASKAAELLVHYLQSVWTKAGLQFHEDNVIEVCQIVDHIVDAAVAESREETRRWFSEEQSR